ncbi:hypothetical protein P692DRAFT_201869084 [Suillus brevipes Sb2]|nr:hypothetical protein P692DRAFT_201869084 [Suillus brevipes Sb2]
MTVVSDDPSWWPIIHSQLFYSYWIVASGVVVVYDWVLTLGQEIELIWKQRWSLMTVLYLVIRYIGIPFVVGNVLRNIAYYGISGTNVVVAAMLGAIMIARLHAMYQGSKLMFIFLVIIFLVVNIACIVITAIGLSNTVAEEFILSGMHMCNFGTEANPLLAPMVWVLNTVWEVLALFLSVWIAVKHFRDLRRLDSSTGSVIGDCFRVLIKSHVLYFASFAGVSCLQLSYLSPELENPYSIGVQILDVSDDPSWWPLISSAQLNSYWIVAASGVVIYDWIMTLAQEVELVWRQRFSLMTVLYLSVRYTGVLYAVGWILSTLPTVSQTDAGIMQAIMTTRLYAMYQGSRKMLVFLVVILLAINIACGALTAISLKYVEGEELILSGSHVCTYYYARDVQLLISTIWILTTVWEVLALFLSIWVSVKHFRELRLLRVGQPTGSIVEDYFTVLVKSHALYFGSFTAVSCLQLAYLSPSLLDSNSAGTVIFSNILQILSNVQLFVLGPRLILSVREYHTNLVTDSDAATGMTSIAFQERVHVSSSNTV